MSRLGYQHTLESEIIRQITRTNVVDSSVFLTILTPCSPWRQLQVNVDTEWIPWQPHQRPTPHHSVLGLQVDRNQSGELSHVIFGISFMLLHRDRGQPNGVKVGIRHVLSLGGRQSGGFTKRRNRSLFNDWITENENKPFIFHTMFIAFVVNSSLTFYNKWNENDSTYRQAYRYIWLRKQLTKLERLRSKNLCISRCLP